MVAILLGIQQQLAQLTPMNQQLQAMQNGLETVQNKVAYMQANQDDSDYDDYSIDGTELEDIARDANKFFIGDGGAENENAKGRGRRKGAGVASNIVKRNTRKA